MSKRAEQGNFNIALLDILSGALGAVIILYIAVPKMQAKQVLPEPVKCPEINPVPAAMPTPGACPTPQVITKIVEKKVPTPANPLISPLDVGFKFKGKNIVLVIDVSGSMKNEDRLGQVKAGLKMLITTMGKDFNIDVIFYPYRKFDNFKALWSELRPINDHNKQEIYNFLFKLRADGATPTRDVMHFALYNYPKATDIVLLSDGAPSVGNTAKLEDIGDVLDDLVARNKHNISINTIGVGRDFLKNNENDSYKFLHELAKRSGGFFLGF